MKKPGGWQADPGKKEITMTDHLRGLSLAQVVELRGKAFAEIRQHTTAIDRLATPLGDLDVALQTAIAVRTIDDQQKLVTSARRLAEILDGGA